MADNPLTSEDPEGSQRRWWIILGIILFLLLLIALGFLTNPGKQILDSLGIHLNGTEEPTSEPVAGASIVATPPPTDEPTETAEPTEKPTEEPTVEPTEQPTEEPTEQIVSNPPVVGDGGCFAACDPDHSNCLGGLACVPGASDTGYVCWGMATCQVGGPDVTPTVTPEMVCNPGQWTGCGGMPPDVVCPWNYVTQCQPDGTWGACIRDPHTCEPSGPTSGPTCVLTGDLSVDCDCCSHLPDVYLMCAGGSTVLDTGGYCSSWCGPC